MESNPPDPQSAQSAARASGSFGTHSSPHNPLRELITNPLDGTLRSSKYYFFGSAVAGAVDSDAPGSAAAGDFGGPAGFFSLHPVNMAMARKIMHRKVRLLMIITSSGRIIQAQRGPSLRGGSSLVGDSRHSGD